MGNGSEGRVNGGLIKTKNYGYSTKPYGNPVLYKLTKDIKKRSLKKCSEWVSNARRLKLIKCKSQCLLINYWSGWPRT